jgi:hypothetical protein
MCFAVDLARATDATCDPDGSIAVGLRLESWTAPGDRIAHLFVMEAFGRSLVHAVVREPEGPTLRMGSGLFTRDALSCDRDALLAVVELAPASLLSVIGICTDDGRPDHLANQMEAALHSLEKSRDGRNCYGARFTMHLGGGDKDTPLTPSGHYPTSGIHYQAARDWRESFDLTPPPTGRWWTVRKGRPNLSGRWDWADGQEPFADVLAPWAAALRRTVLPGALSRLGPSSWSLVSYSHHSADGEAGRRRGQAALLQPVFALTLAHDAFLADLVDRGRPFERELLELVRATIPEVAEGLDLAKLRRLRTYGHTPALGGTAGLRDVLDIVRRLPVDRLPSTPEGWGNMRDQVLPWLSRCIDAFDPDIVLRGIPDDWNLASVIGDPDPESLRTPAEEARLEFIGLRDMAERLADTLVKSAAPHLWANQKLGVATAFGILCEGRSLLGAYALQRRWHAELTAFERALAVSENLSWPALCGPFHADGGIVLRFLTSSEELAAEGARGNVDGMEGLDHCVGGYSLRCASGELQVASVTGPAPGGGRRRLSTVALTKTWRGMSVDQHLGMRNGPPPAEAKRALAAFVAAVLDEGVTIDRSVFELREVLESGPRDPKVLFEAWRPYLPKRVANGDVEAFKAAFPRPARSPAGQAVPEPDADPAPFCMR